MPAVRKLGFSGELGRRRPGYSTAIEYGLSCALASQRTGEYQNGDAAFADFVVIAGFTRRF
jgi:hypothetical protein